MLESNFYTQNVDQFGANSFYRGTALNTNEDDLPEKEIISFMNVGYRHLDIISFDLIDAMANCLIQMRLKSDSEFKLALGEGYYK